MPGSTTRKGAALARPAGRSVPASPYALIGREAELAVACRWLRETGVRLVTLTGPAGVGKTRLALAVAEALLDAFDQVAIVTLAAVRDPSLVLPTVVHTLGLRLSAHERPIDRLVSALGERRTLLVLDNFEQVIEAAPSVANVLAACPAVTMLITSRAALRLRWEQQLPLLPLALPDPQCGADLGSVGAAPAVRLFVERARAVQPAFALTPENVAAVAGLCRQLDGLPLAIELAAARSTVLTPRQLLERLEWTPGDADGGRLALLGTGAHDLPERQQTLRRAIGWSYDLLSADERALFRRLAVFSGGCTESAARAVCLDAAANDAPATGILEGLASLVEKSLLCRDPNAGAEPRFLMLETVRAFALEQLRANAEEHTVRGRHAAYFTALAEQAEPELRGPRRLRWLERLECELENLRAASAWLQRDARDGVQSLRLAGALFWFLEARGRFAEARAWLDGALSLPEAASPSPSRALALHGAGHAAGHYGEIEAARAYLEESVALWRRCAAPRQLANALTCIYLHARFADLPAARAALAEAGQIARTYGYRWYEAEVQHSLGHLALSQGDLQEARRYFEHGAWLFHRAGDQRSLGGVLRDLGTVAIQIGDFPAARSLLVRALAVVREQRDDWYAAYVLLDLALLSVYEGSATAAADLATVLTACREHGYQGVIMPVVAGLARVALRNGAVEEAARLLGLGEAAAEAWGAWSPLWAEAEQRALRCEVQERAGSERFARLVQSGRAVPPAELLSQALAACRRVAEPPADAGPNRQLRRAELPEPVHFSPRELEVLRLAAGGYTSKEIARELVLSERTVENHLFRIYARLGARGRSDAVAYAIRHGLA